MIAYIVYFFISILMGIVLLLLSIFNAKIRSNYYNSYKQIFKLLQLSGDIKNSNRKVLMFHCMRKDQTVGSHQIIMEDQLKKEKKLDFGTH